MFGERARFACLGAPLACLFGLFCSTPAFGQTCVSGRPTDPGGTQGIDYDGAEVGSFDSPAGLARVHFALSGGHAPPAASTLEDGIPDAVVVAAEAADQALRTFEAQGFAPPLGDVDSPCQSHGDSDAVDIYLIHFAAADGQAPIDHCLPGQPRRCAGFVLVENDFRGGGYASVAEGLRTVVPHELFHLVQDAYDADLERWWAEGSAQWAAKQVYPELTDLERFLPAYFDNPWRPLNVPPTGIITDFLYATAIWPVFLHERVGADVVREIEESFDGTPDSVLPKTAEVLEAHGSSLGEQFVWFAAYNAATGERAPSSGGYAQAADYPLVPLTTFDVEAGASLSEVASGLGAYYYRVSSSEALELTLEADPERLQALLLPLIDGRAELDQAEPLPAILKGDGIVVVAGQSLSRVDAPFELIARSVAEGEQPTGEEPKPAQDEPEASGCSLTAAPPEGAIGASVGLGFVITLLGARRLGRARKDD